MTTIRSQNATVTTGNLDLYVSQPGGDDANNGLTPGSAVQTMAAAIAKIPNGVYNRVIVHVGAYGGGGSYVPPVLNRHELREDILIYGDGAGQPGEDGFVQQLAPSAAQAGTTTLKVVSTGGLVANAYRGMTIQIQSGAANGDMRTIRDNGTTDITPCVPFSAGIAPGDTYRIVTPSVIWDVPAAVSGVPFMMVQDCGTPTTDPGTVIDSPAVYLINVQVTAAASTTVWAMSGSRVIMFGVDCPTVITNVCVPVPRWRGCEVGSGYDQATGAQTPVTELGVPSITSWKGWGLSYRTTSTAGPTLPAVYGTLVAPGLVVQQNVVLFGGNIFGPGTGGNGPLESRRGGFLTLFASAGGPAFLVQGAASAGGAIGANGGAVLISGPCTVANSAGPGILANNPQGYFNAGATGFLSGTGSTVGAQARAGASINFTGTVGVTGPAGADLTVNALQTSYAAAVLGATGDCITDFTGTVILRGS